MDPLAPVPQKSDTPMSLIARFFHLRIEQAATRLGICPTVGRRCRPEGHTPAITCIHMMAVFIVLAAIMEDLPVVHLLLQAA